MYLPLIIWPILLYNKYFVEILFSKNIIACVEISRDSSLELVDSSCYVLYRISDHFMPCIKI